MGRKSLYILSVLNHMNHSQQTSNNISSRTKIQQTFKCKLTDQAEFSTAHKNHDFDFTTQFVIYLFVLKLGAVAMLKYFCVAPHLYKCDS